MNTEAKKLMVVALILILGVLYTVSRATDDETFILYKGILIQTQMEGTKTVLVDGQFETEKSSPSTVTSFSLSSLAKVYHEKEEKEPEDLHPGMYVEIKSSPEIRTSFPAQGTALEIRVVEPENAPLFMEATVLGVLDKEEGLIGKLHLKGFLQGYGQETELYVSIPVDSYYPFPSDLIEDRIQPGDTIFAVLRGPVRESYPLQGTTSSITLISRERP